MIGNWKGEGRYSCCLDSCSSEGAELINSPISPLAPLGRHSDIKGRVLPASAMFSMSLRLVTNLAENLLSEVVYHGTLDL